MRSSTFHRFLSLVFFMALTGCAAHQKLLTPQTQVLTYHLAYDLAYLRTLEAVEKVPDWLLTETEKEKGIIKLRDINYSRLDDADRREVTVLVKRTGYRETSVELAPESQRVFGGDKLLEMIAKYLSKEIQSTAVESV